MWECVRAAEVAALGSVDAAFIYILYPSILEQLKLALMSHTVLNKKPLLARIRRIKGQTEALERALESSAECEVILQQLAAVRGAVNGLMLEVLEGHVREHLGEADAPAEQRAKDLDLVVSVMRSYVK